MILVIDNYDSFTYNLVQYLGMCGAPVLVRRNDEIELTEILALRPSGIMLSPGPCRPERSGICLHVLSNALSRSPTAPLRGIPILGVCLGHQAIGVAGGAVVTRANTIMHGKTSLIRHDGQGLFQGMPNPFRAVRYHSLVVTPESVPSEFTVSAISEDDNEVMGIRHKSLPVRGVQFHPESVLTEEGFRIVQNFVKMTKKVRTVAGYAN